MSYETSHPVKKKKRSFLQQAKKEAKSGRYGNGKQLSEEEYHYYIRVYEQLKHVEKDEKDVLVRNFFREMEKDGNIKLLVTNQIVSRILDDTLPLASFSHIVSFLQLFSSNLRLYCVDPFASHVLQTLLTVCFQYSQKMKNETPDEESKQEPSDEQKEEFKTFIMNSSKFIYNNLQDFVQETYASHIVRTVLEVCSGIEVSRSVRSSQKTQTSHTIRDDPQQIINVTDDFLQLVADISTRLMKLPNFTEVIACEQGSAVLQTALFVLAGIGQTEKLAEMVSHIIEQGFTPMNADEKCSINSLFELPPTCRLMEALLVSASSKQLRGLFTTFFSGDLRDMVCHRYANFAVQKLLTSWKKKKSFSPLYDETTECLRSALEAGSSGVILALVRACRGLSSHQEDCMEKLLELMECCQDVPCEPDFLQTLLYLTPLPAFRESREANQLPPTSLHGSLILQELLNFKHPNQIVAGFLGLPTGDLVKLACDMRACHIVGALMKSRSINEPDREKIVSRLNGNFVKLACSKHGSRSLEDIWNSVSIKIKTDICKELFDDKLKLNESLYGKIIFTKFEINSFSKRQGNQSWEEVQQKKLKKREFLEKMLDDAGEMNKPRKKLKH